jgi:hypothetical protein
MREIRRFVPARRADLDLPLHRYLEHLSADVVGRYLACYTDPEDLVLDPMAQRPTVTRTAAYSSRKAVASNLNPICTLLIGGMLTLPEAAELDAATTQLGDSQKRGVPLRDHVNNLYASTCSGCSGLLIVDHFLWNGERDQPVQKHYECPTCGQAGEFPVDDADLRVLDSLEAQGVHYWYLLDRLAQPHEPERQLAEELLHLYTPRNLYALADISRRIEALFAGSPVQTALQLILLSCLDSCSKLGGAPLPRATTMHLQPPSKFMERNVWQALEEAYRNLRRLAPAPHIRLASRLEELMEEDAQAVVLNEPVRKVAALLPRGSVALVICAPPRYYRPFWTLSYLWSGWLWGRDKAALLRPLIGRKTMGWSWYRRTLAASLQTLHRPLKDPGSMIFLLEETDLTHISNLILASLGAAFKLDGILYQPQYITPPRHPKQGVPGAYRLSFSKDETTYAETAGLSSESLVPQLRQAALGAIMGVLRERGQALHLGWLHAAVWERWAREGLLRRAVALEGELSPADFLQEQLEASLDEGLEEGALALVPAEPGGEPIPQLWWLNERGYPARPLGDRVEETMSQILDDAGLSRDQLEDTIYDRFPGPLTPDFALLDECLSSYGLPHAASGTWSLRPEDRSESLSRERNDALAMLGTVGRRLGYRIRGSADGGDSQAKRHPPTAVDLSWEEGGRERHHFALRQTIRFGDLLAQSFEGKDVVQRYIVIPDRRVSLLRFRMDTEALLSKSLAEGPWRLIKLDNLRALAAREELGQDVLEHIVGLEPTVESPDAQLPLFS